MLDVEVTERNGNIRVIHKLSKRRTCDSAVEPFVLLSVFTRRLPEYQLNPYLGKPNLPPFFLLPALFISTFGHRYE
jgi:hypothetical protein